MGNIIDYIEAYGAYSFLERPFTDEDSLVLAQFSYLKLENIGMPLEADRYVTLGEIGRMPERERIFDEVFFPLENRALFEGMRQSRRFQTMKIGGFVSRMDFGTSMQFSAVACLLEDGSTYIAFRGTDETLTGWKEDFKMAYDFPVRSQELSVEYLNRFGIGGRLFVGGHSKGGNLAVYAAMHCEERVRERIKWIYSMDGPGFHPRLRCSAAYERIEERIRKIIPKSSFIGMLLEDTEVYEVVESSSFGMLQHNPFSWVIEDGRFVTAEAVGRSRRAVGEILNRWIESLTEEEIHTFVEELFAVAEASDTETVLEFPGKWKQILGRLTEAVRSAEPETKKEFAGMLKALYDSAKEVLIRRS